MSTDMAQLFWFFSIAVILVAIIGVYCILASFNMIRILIGLEILVKAATLLIILAGYMTKQIALAQVIVITLIVIEVVVMVIAGGVALWAFRHNGTVDPRTLSDLKE